jgi:hypothetical protein
VEVLNGSCRSIIESAPEPVFREQVTVVVVAWALDRERRRGEASNLVESLDTTVQPALGEPGK